MFWASISEFYFFTSGHAHHPLTASLNAPLTHLFLTQTRHQILKLELNTQNLVARPLKQNAPRLVPAEPGRRPLALSRGQNLAAAVQLAQGEDERVVVREVEDEHASWRREVRLVVGRGHGSP